MRKNWEGEPPGEPSPQKSLPHEARREPRPPDLDRFRIFSHPQGCRDGFGQNPPLKAEAFFPLPERGFSEELKLK